MTNPQLEKGFIRIATGKNDNDILSALIILDLTATEYKVLLTVIRKTWGFQKKQDWISYSQFVKLTGKSRISIWTAIKKLVKQGLLVKQTEPGKRTLYSVNKVQLVKQAELVKKAKLVKSTEHTSSVYLTQLVKQTEPTKETITKETITKDIIPKGITKKRLPNQDINFLIKYLKEKLGLPMLDGSQKQNRRYCWLALKKFGGRDKIKLLIDATAVDEFWKTKITSFQSLYYKGVQIISNTRGVKPNVAVL